MSARKKAGTDDRAARQDYKYPTGLAAFLALPFIHRDRRCRKNSSNWHVPPTVDYEEACEIGQEYAAHYLQFLKDNPQEVGVNNLGVFLADMDFDSTDDTKGYHVGFFSHLERFLYSAAKNSNVFADLEMCKARHCEAVKQRAAQAEEAQS